MTATPAETLKAEERDPETGRVCVALAENNLCIKVDATVCPAPASLGRQVFAEFLGTMFLVATIIGSGMMGDNLSADDGVALLGNTLATWGILYVLITTLGPVSGAHFNPVVTLAFWLKRECDTRAAALFAPAQVGGAIVGASVPPASAGDGTKKNSGFVKGTSRTPCSCTATARSTARTGTPTASSSPSS